MTETKAHYLWLPPGKQPTEVSGFAPFKAIVVLSAEYSGDWQKEISEWLVVSGCRYMMAWGPDSVTWDDSVDWADLEARGFEQDDQSFVMTTWHSNESLESVFWYSQFCANLSYDDVPLTNALILDISNEAREQGLLDLFEQSKTLAEREPD